MRVWDVSPELLCRNHLLGEHNEIHSLWTIITENRAGYSRHPETLRWVGRLAALYARHAAIVAEMRKRGYKHASLLDEKLAIGAKTQVRFVNTIEEQIVLLGMKKCKCKI